MQGWQRAHWDNDLFIPCLCGEICLHLSCCMLHCMARVALHGATQHARQQDHFAKQQVDNFDAYCCCSANLKHTEHSRSNSLRFSHSIIVTQGICKTAQEALDLYGFKRTLDGNGVTNASQRRFVARPKSACEKASPHTFVSPYIRSICTPPPPQVFWFKRCPHCIKPSIGSHAAHRAGYQLSSQVQSAFH